MHTSVLTSIAWYAAGVASVLRFAQCESSSVLFLHHCPCRDPTMYEYGAKPSTDQGAYVSIQSGAKVVSSYRKMMRNDLVLKLCLLSPECQAQQQRSSFLTYPSPSSFQVTPAKYMEAVTALRPDLYVALCDEITHDAKPKKIDQAIKRSAKVSKEQYLFHLLIFAYGH